MGVLAPRSAHARASTWPPIDISGNFPALVSASHLKDLPQCVPVKFLLILWNNNLGKNDQQFSIDTLQDKVTTSVPDQSLINLPLKMFNAQDRTDFYTFI